MLVISNHFDFLDSPSSRLQKLKWVVNWRLTRTFSPWLPAGIKHFLRAHIYLFALWFIFAPTWPEHCISNLPFVTNYNYLRFINSRYEASCDRSALSDNIVSKAVAQNLSPLSDILASTYDAEVLHAVASVIESLPFSCISSLPLQLTLRVTKNCIKYFFICVTEKGNFLIWVFKKKEDLSFNSIL